MKYHWNIKTEMPVSYNIKTSLNLFSKENKDILSYGNQTEDRRRLIVVDKSVAFYYLDNIKSYFEYHKINYHIVLLDGGEDEKNLKNLLYLLEEIENFGISRKNEPIIGIGGGVVLDVLGLASTLYRRGIPYIRIPTTLLGIVDVSVAAKTGINFMNRRNRLGSYYPPLSTLLDKSFLKTLEPIEISSGLGEILKMAVIKDKKLFSILEKHSKQLLDTKFNCDWADEVISRSIEGMKVELESNLWEKNLKRVVDFGHSLSPIIEMRSIPDDSIPTLTHGQAVTLDVIFSSCISYTRNMMSYDDLIRIVKVAKNMGLPTFHPSFINSLLLLESLNDTIKHRNGDQNLPTPTKIGESIFINDLTLEEINKTIKIFKKIDEK